MLVHSIWPWDDGNKLRNIVTIKSPKYLLSNDVSLIDSNKLAKKKQSWVLKKCATPQVQINDITDHKGTANLIERLIDSALKAKKGGQWSLACVIELAHQITPASYLGQALKQIGKHMKCRTPDSVTIAFFSPFFLCYIFLSFGSYDHCFNLASHHSFRMPSA